MINRSWDDWIRGGGMRKESQRSEEEWRNKGQIGRQRRRIARIRSITYTFVQWPFRSSQKSWFLGFSIIWPVQLTPHNNQWAMELKSSISRTGGPTPLTNHTHAGSLGNVGFLLSLLLLVFFLNTLPHCIFVCVIPDHRCLFLSLSHTQD